MKEQIRSHSPPLKKSYTENTFRGVYVFSICTIQYFYYSESHFLILMVASRKISSLGSGLKFELEEHKQHIKPPPRTPSPHVTGEIQSFPSEVPAIIGRAEEGTKTASKEITQSMNSGQ